jgi:molybdopterin synthase catalytic subunit
MPQDEVVMPPHVRVRCRFFARYAEVLGTATHDLRLPVGTTVGTAVRSLRASLPGGQALPEVPLAAVNLEHVDHEHVLADGDELALLPPLAGG